VEEALHRRERLHVLYCVRRGKAVDGRLIEPDERKVRRGEGTRRRRPAVPYESEQFRAEGAGQPLDGLGSVPVDAVMEADLQASFRDEADHLDQVRTRTAWGAPGTGGFRRETEERRTGHHLVELPEIVEEQVGSRQRRQSRAGLGVQIAQGPEAQPAIGERPKLFLHRLQRAGLARIGGQVQGEREERREPSHRAGQIEIGEQVLAPVALEVYAKTVAARPGRHGSSERGEERVVNLRSVRGRHLLQERERLLARERHDGSADAGLGVVAGRVVRRQGAGRARSQPVGQRATEAACGGMRCQTFRPLLVGGGPRRQARRAAPFRICALDVLEQDPPRHAVHDEVVEDEEQPAGPGRPQAEEGRPGQRSALQVQAALQHGRRHLEGARPLVFAER
jgi:hypothetical protein